MYVSLEGILARDLRAETMRAQITQHFGPMKNQVKEVKVFPLPGDISDMSDLKSYGFNTHFYGGEWHKSQAASMLGLKSALTRMVNSGKPITANYRRLVSIWNPVAGFALGRHYNTRLFNEFGDWESSPPALNRCWDYLYECLEQKKVIRTNDHRGTRTEGASLFWIPDDPKYDIRDPETKGIIWVEHSNSYVKLNGSLGMVDRPYIRELNLTTPTPPPVSPNTSEQEIQKIRESVNWDLGYERDYDYATK